MSTEYIEELLFLKFEPCFKYKLQVSVAESVVKSPATLKFEVLADPFIKA